MPVLLLGGYGPFSCLGAGYLSNFGLIVTAERSTVKNGAATIADSAALNLPDISDELGLSPSA
ncbi:hypothetical protein ACFC0M_25985 [Streptomyces sp. NPDC056149]|uniref:hypothetical protein n=1 Tax=Streptomyces sp. NPDC056149 TaxID=3345728 RepID=UPI0035D64CD8